MNVRVCVHACVRKRHTTQGSLCYRRRCVQLPLQVRLVAQSDLAPLGICRPVALHRPCYIESLQSNACIGQRESAFRRRRCFLPSRNRPPSPLRHGHLCGAVAHLADLVVKGLDPRLVSADCVMRGTCSAASGAFPARAQLLAARVAGQERQDEAPAWTHPRRRIWVSMKFSDPSIRSKVSPHTVGKRP